MRELEIRYKVDNIRQITEKMTALRFRCHQFFMREKTEFYDTPNADLQVHKEFLRLTEGIDHNILTFKGQMDAQENLAGVKLREEIETEVADITAMRDILTRIGMKKYGWYVISRSIWETPELGVKINVDQTSIGDFAEVEGPSVEQIEATARRIGIYHKNVEPRSYHTILRNFS